MLDLFILAGGYGTRLSEYTKTIPKPMVKIGNEPILIHIIKYYAKFGVKNIFIALGYKKDVIINHFKRNAYNFKKVDNNLQLCEMNFGKNYNCRINLINTGINTMTGGRVKRLLNVSKKENYFLTYGDGVSNVNLNKLYDFHIKNNAIMTLTAVHPPARFGYVKIKKDKVKIFREKSQIDLGWINGGFFIINKKIKKLIKNDQTFLEKEPMESLATSEKLYAFKHKGFWQCMDTKRDKELLDELYKNDKIPWLK